MKFAIALIALAFATPAAAQGPSGERPDMGALAAELELVPPVPIQALFDNVAHCESLLASRQPDVTDARYGWEVRYSEGENHIMTAPGLLAMYGHDDRRNATSCMVTSRIDIIVDAVAAQFAAERGFPAPQPLQSESENRNPRFAIPAGDLTYFFGEAVRPRGAVGIFIVRSSER